MAVVLVTGGSSGIGLATVRQLAAAGDRVFCASRNPGRAGLPDGVTPVVLDVADPDSCRDAIDTVMALAGRLDVLVNNAGAVGLASLEEAGDEEGHRIFEVNVFGPMRLATAAVPVMRAAGGGRIINVTSENDVAPAPFGGWYSASKAALASASVVLDAEVHGFGIFVTVLAPGLFRTPMSDAFGSYHAPEGSPYAAAFAVAVEQSAAEVANAGDPDQVARAIDGCIRADDPPARIVVGADAEEMEKTVRAASPDGLAKMMREYVAGLTAGQ
jgi:NAD(P)-dependent dehydrogenase (short-subunit alcohol dehydrogenase family)